VDDFMGMEGVVTDWFFREGIEDFQSKWPSELIRAWVLKSRIQAEGNDPWNGRVNDQCD